MLINRGDEEIGFTEYVTREDGGIVFCLTGVHSVCDGTSFFTMMQEWARACHGVAPTGPSNDREVMIALGKAKVAARIAELNLHCKQGLAAMPHVTLHTPMDPSVSAGIITFEVKGLTPEEVATALEHHRAAFAAMRAGEPLLDALGPLGIKQLDMPATPSRVWQAINGAGPRQAGQLADTDVERVNRALGRG